MEKVKLIWDFRGGGALKTAEHHAIHLNEFIVKEKLENCVGGFEPQSEFIASAFIVCPREQMISLRDALKPHRGELYED